MPDSDLIALIEALHAHGYRVRASGRLERPDLPPALLERVRRRRADLLAWAEAEAAADRGDDPAADAVREYRFADGAVRTLWPRDVSPAGYDAPTHAGHPLGAVAWRWSGMLLWKHFGGEA